MKVEPSANDFSNKRLPLWRFTVFPQGGGQRWEIEMVIVCVIIFISGILRQDEFHPFRGPMVVSKEFG